MKWNTTQPIKRNGFESASWTEVDGLRAHYTEWSKSEREKFHILMHICVIQEKWYWWAYLQGRKRDVENEHMDTVGEGESEMNWNGSMDIYTLPCVEQIVSGTLLANTGDQPALCDDRAGWEAGMGERLRREQIRVCSWLIYLVVWQKRMQHHKPIILQLKFKK